ncbi:hypothetical protein DMENIID0001_118050 [Sergentomyia squamirostris]
MYVCWMNSPQMGIIPSTIIWPQYPQLQQQSTFSPFPMRSWTQTGTCIMDNISQHDEIIIATRVSSSTNPMVKSVFLSAYMLVR